MRYLIALSLGIILVTLPLSAMAHYKDSYSDEYGYYSKHYPYYHHYSRYSRRYHTPYYSKYRHYYTPYYNQYWRYHSPYYKSTYYSPYYRPYGCRYSYKLYHGHYHDPYHRYFYRGHYCREANPGTKLSAGIADVALSWTEVPKAIIDNTQKSDPLTGLVVGTVEGTATAVVDAVSGTVDATFFAIPPYREFDTPPYYGYSGYRKSSLGEDLKDRFKFEEWDW